MQDQATAHERPFAALDLHQLIGQQLIADHSVLDEDARVDRAGSQHLARRRGETEQIVEVDGSGETGDWAEWRREIEIGGGEVAARRDLARCGPVYPAAAADRAVDEGDDALGQAGDLVRLQVRPERQARHIEDGVP